MHSIRSRLVFPILLGVLLLSALAGAGLVLVLRDRLTSEFDRGLEAKARALAALTTLDGRRIEFDFEEDIMPEFRRADEEGDQDEDEDGDSDDEDDEEDEDEDDRPAGPEYFTLHYADGQLIAKSTSLKSADELAVDLSFPANRRALAVKLPDGRPGRLLQFRFNPRIEEFDPEEPLETDGEESTFDLPPDVDEQSATVILVVARGTSGLDELLATLTWAVALAVLVLLAGIGILVPCVVRWGFRPVRELHDQVTTMGPESLTRRVSLSSRTDELSGIVESLNSLLDRLEGGFSRERRFTSDVAHELRTPVAELLTACDVGAKWPDDAQACERLFEDIRGAARQMASIVESLLELARCDSGNATVATSAVPLHDLVETCWKHTNGRAEERGITLVNEITSELSVESDPDKLRIMVQNLLDNAAVHGALESSVFCRTAPSPETLDLVVRNKAESLRREDAPFLFDRLWQSDASRSSEGHFGLGLSIVKALSTLLGHPVQAALLEDSILELRIQFKRAS